MRINHPACYCMHRAVLVCAASAGSPHPIYQKWIDKYGGEEFDKLTRTVEGIVDQAALELTAEQVGGRSSGAAGCIARSVALDARDARS